MMMLFAKNFISPAKISPHIQLTRNGRQSKTISYSKKSNQDEDSQIEKLSFNLKVPNAIVAKSLVAVFGLGFIDAGYSGDWSRIGVISKENEELLKAAAYLVVPFCLFLMLSFSDKEKNDDTSYLD